MSEEPEDLNKLFSQLAGGATMSPLDAQSHEMHEMFLSLTRVGFSDRQALFIVSMAVVSLDYDESESFSNHPSDASFDLQPSTDWDPEEEEEDDEDEDEEDKPSV